jgi:hypothetical protein
MVVGALRLAGERSSAGKHAVVVRRAEDAELAAIVELARRLHAESVYKSLPFDARKVGVLVAFCARDTSCFGRVAEIGGEVSGFLGGKLTTYPFCNEVFAYDLGFYVAKERRASLGAVAPLHAFRAWAEEKGAREIALAVSSGIEPERVGRLYERMGLTCVGGIYRAPLGRGG